jgi:hypothetical protein
MGKHLSLDIILTFSCRMMLLLEECLLCYGVATVSYMDKMKLNLQNLVCLHKI